MVTVYASSDEPTGAPTSGGMVTSSSIPVSEVGAATLAAGGTAADAALAMAAMSFVTLPGQCGIGGDAFAVWYEAASGRYRAVQGSGLGPDGADVDFYRHQGLAAIPLAGPLACAVPGAPAAMATLQASMGTRPLDELWAPAIAAARHGIEVSAQLHGDIAAGVDKLTADPAAAATFLPGGEVPAVGSTFRQPDLATTLEELAADLSSFYTGDIARRCLAALGGAGAPFSGREWAATAAPATEALAGNYAGHRLYENPLPSPGYMVLQQAAVLDGVLGDLGWLSPEAIGWMAGAAATAFAQRRAHVGSDSAGWESLLGAENISAVRRRLAAGGRPPVGGAMAGGDTTSFVAVDAAGNAVSYIHSLAFLFGAGVMAPGTGIVFNDRLGRGAYLDPDHPNGLRPGRRPLHTLNAWLAAGSDGRPVLAGNTPGGDGQVQWNMQVLSHLLDHHLDPQAAVAAPRFSVFPGSDADAVGAPDELRVESRLGEATIETLRAAGRPVVLQGPWEGGGSAQVIALDPATGQRRGGSDPRFDGGVRTA